MANPAGKLEAQALKLSPEERARLAERLISSLDEELDPGAEALWLREAEQRLEQIENGDVSSIPADQVTEKARSSLS
jgi:putative addiction module component (TIGR02574 family)